jgi:hypothetical protein
MKFFHPPRLGFRKGFDLARLAWGRPDSPQRALCSYCHAKLPEVPLMMWNSKGACVAFCDECVEEWIEVK